MRDEAYCMLRQIEAILMTPPPNGYLDEDRRAQVLPETIDWLQRIYMSMEDLYYLMHPAGQIKKAGLTRISAFLINVFRLLQGIRTWLQPVSCVVECRLFRCMGRIFSFILTEKECYSFLTTFLARHLSRIEEFAFNTAVLPTMEEDELKCMDAISNLLVGQYTFQNLHEFQDGVDLYEMPDDLHPMTLYYTVAEVINFYWGIWMIEKRSLSELHLPAFMRHQLASLLLKLLDLIDRIVHKQKDYFPLLGGLLEALFCNAMPIVLPSDATGSPSIPIITPPSTIATLFKKLCSINAVGRGFSTDFSILESSLFLSVAAILNTVPHCDSRSSVTPQLIYDEANAFVSCIFQYFGRFTQRRFKVAPAAYPGFYPPIGLALALTNMDWEQDFIFTVVSRILTTPCENGANRIMPFLAQQTGQYQAALMLSSLSVAVVCAADSCPNPINGGFLLIHGMLLRGKLPRQAIYWISLSLMHSIVFQTWRFPDTKNGQHRFCRYVLQPPILFHKSEFRLRTRLKQHLGVDRDVIADVHDLKFLHDHIRRTTRVENFVTMSQCLLMCAREVHADALQVCFAVGNGVGRWKRRRVREEELGFQCIVEELMSFMNNVPLDARLRVVEVLTNPKKTTQEMQNGLKEFLKCNHRAYEKAF